MECLSAAGFRAELPVCVSWLGVTVYLSEEAIFRLLSVVAHLPRGSSIFFDYHVPENMLDSVQQAVVEVMKQKVASFGEPWITTFEPTLLREQCLALGFREVESCDFERIEQTVSFSPKEWAKVGRKGSRCAHMNLRGDKHEEDRQLGLTAR